MIRIITDGEFLNHYQGHQEILELAESIQDGEVFVNGEKQQLAEDSKLLKFAKAFVEAEANFDNLLFELDYEWG